MKKEKNNPRVVYMGRYNINEILSGPEKTAKRIFSEYSQQDSGIFIQYFFDGTQYSFIKKLFGKEVIAINDSAVYTLGLFRILPVLFKFKPQIIHYITYERFEIIALIYKLISSVKIIYNVHGIIAYENNELKSVSGWYKLKDIICERLYLKYSDKIIFMSGSSIDITEKYFKIKNDKCIILANGIDEQFSKVNHQKNIAGLLKIVFIAGSELHGSGLEFLKSVITELYVQIELFIIGSIIDSSLDRLNKNVKIHFINKMDSAKLAEFYNDKDIFFSLNKYDTFSTSSIEAMAAGLIPIVTKETGMSRYITDNENGYIIEYANNMQISSIIDNLSKNPELKEKISTESRKIYEMLSWKQVYETYITIYKGLN